MGSKRLDALTLFPMILAMEEPLNERREGTFPISDLQLSHNQNQQHSFITSFPRKLITVNKSASGEECKQDFLFVFFKSNDWMSVVNKIWTTTSQEDPKKIHLWAGFMINKEYHTDSLRNLRETQTRVTSFLSQRCKPSFQAFWRSSVRLFWSETAASAGWKLPPPPCRWAPSPCRQEPGRHDVHNRDQHVRGASKHSGTSCRGRIVWLMSRL